jgi:hypothetical protein
MTMNRPFRHRLYVLIAPAIVAVAAVGLPAVSANARGPAASPATRDVSTQDVVVDHSVHDVSAPLRNFRSAAAPTQAATETAAAETSGAPSADTASPADAAPTADAAPLGPAPDGGKVEQTSFGPRPALPTVASFDNGLNGGSTSDNNIAAGPDSIVVMRNSQFRVMTKTGATTFGPVNNNSIFAGTNTIEPVALTNYANDGDSYQLQYNGDTSIPIVRGQNNTAAGIQAAIQGGNEQQQVSLSGYTGSNSYTLNHDGVDSAPFVRGVNDNAAAITTALNGVSETQTVSLNNYDTDGDTYTLNYNGHDSAPIVRGQNDAPAGIQNALQAATRYRRSRSRISIPLMPATSSG